MHARPILPILAALTTFVASESGTTAPTAITPSSPAADLVRSTDAWIGFAYVTSFYANSVSVFDLASNTVTATIAVGRSPEAVAVTPDGAFVYVANTNSQDVFVIRTSDNTVMATVDVGGSLRLCDQLAYRSSRGRCVGHPDF